jgi:hypothetical protein
VSYPLTAYSADPLVGGGTTLRPGEAVRATTYHGVVRQVGVDMRPGYGMAVVTVEWSHVVDEDGRQLETPADDEDKLEVLEVPDMHHVSLPHLEVFREGGWLRVSEEDFWAEREAGLG